MIDFPNITISALWSIGVLTVIMFFGTLALLPIIVARIPADYFVRDRKKQHRDQKDPVRTILIRIVRNILGVLFIIAGVIMIFTPGQGLLSILIGVILTDLPGKMTVGRKIVQRPGVLRAVNWIRRKAQVPPLQVPNKEP